VGFFLGNQARPKLFDLNIVKPEVLYEEVVQVDGRVILDRPDCRLDKKSFRKVVGTTEENLFVVRELDEEKLKSDLEKVKAKG
jgi:5-oxoprolinase (ATP-hydrolysing)